MISESQKPRPQICRQSKLASERDEKICTKEPECYILMMNNLLWELEYDYPIESRR